MTKGDGFPVVARGRQFLPFFDASQRQWTEPWFFVQAADTQFGMQASYIEGRAEAQVTWEQEKMWAAQMVAEVNAMRPRPKFLVVCGDLLDAWPETQPEMRRRQEKDFKEVFAGLDVPLVCVCGNHDVGNTPTPQTIRGWRDAFGDDYFSFWCSGVFFIVINSQYHEDPSKTPVEARRQEEWLERQLEVVRREKPKHAVILQHIPLFLRTPDEEKEYFNMAPRLRKALLERFYDAGVRYIFCGHYHRNARGFYKDLELVVTSAVGAQLGDAGQGYRVVKVTEDRLEHRYYRLGTAPALLAGPSHAAFKPPPPSAAASPKGRRWSFAKSTKAALFQRSASVGL